jgi:hypothetical protein
MTPSYPIPAQYSPFTDLRPVPVLVAKGSLLYAPWQRGVGDTFILIAPTGGILRSMGTYPHYYNTVPPLPAAV